MRYMVFGAGFAVIHAVAYSLAGAIALRISGDIYNDETRLMSYLRDMSDPLERKHVERWFFPAQLVRGTLLALILLPILAALDELSFVLRFLFFFGFLFVGTHFASAAPCPDNIEGLVYMRPQFLRGGSMLKFQFEMVLYSLTVAGMVAWLLF